MQKKSNDRRLAAGEKGGGQLIGWKNGGKKPKQKQPQVQ